MRAALRLGISRQLRDAKITVWTLLVPAEDGFENHGACMKIRIRVQERNDASPHGYVNLHEPGKGA